MNELKNSKPIIIGLVVLVIGLTIGLVLSLTNNNDGDNDTNKILANNNGDKDNTSQTLATNTDVNTDDTNEPVVTSNEADELLEEACSSHSKCQEAIKAFCGEITKECIEVSNTYIIDHATDCYDKETDQFIVCYRTPKNYSVQYEYDDNNDLKYVDVYKLHTRYQYNADGELEAED